jgi:hypothetical protein
LPLPTQVYGRDGMKVVRIDPSFGRLKRGDFEIFMLFFPQFSQGNYANRFVVKGNIYEKDLFLGERKLVDREIIDVKIIHNASGKGLQILEGVYDEDGSLAILARKGLLDNKQQELQREKIRQMENSYLRNLHSTLEAMLEEDAPKVRTRQRMLISIEGFCEDCGNYALLHEEDSLCLCNQCSRYRLHLHRYEILGMQYIPLPF